MKHRSFEAPGKCEVTRCKFRFGLDSGQARVRFRSKLQRCVKGSPSQKHLESWNFGISKERIIIYILLLLLQIPILYPKSITFQSQTQPKPNSNFSPILEPIPAFLPNFTVHPFSPHLSTPTNRVIHRNPAPCRTPRRHCNYFGL